MTTEIELPFLKDGEILVVTHVAGLKLDEPLVLGPWDKVFVSVTQSDIHRESDK